MNKITLVVATGNAGKMREIAEVCEAGHFPVSLKSLTDVFGEVPDIAETETTFEGNSFLKADWVYERCEAFVLADDSGLEVDALGGAPGVFSARYSGEPVNHDRNIAKLLEELKAVPAEKRSARFHCVMVLVGPDGFRRAAHGTVEGHIAFERAGSNGFGYDPVFVPEGWTKTFAEGGAEEKNNISHRGRALRALRGVFDELFA